MSAQDGAAHDSFDKDMALIIFSNTNMQILNTLDPSTTSTFTSATLLETFPTEFRSTLTAGHVKTPSCSFD